MALSRQSLTYVLRLSIWLQLGRFISQTHLVHFSLLMTQRGNVFRGFWRWKASGLENPQGGSPYTFVLVSRSAIVDQEAWRPLNWMRELRNISEYLDRSSSPASLEDALQALEIVRRMLADTQKRYPNKPDMTPDQP